MRRARLGAAVLAAVTAVAGTSASADDLAQARARRAELQQRLDDAAERLAEVEARVAALGDERDAIAAQLDTLGEEIAAAEDRMGDRVRSLYMRGAVDPVLTMLTAPEPQRALERAAVVMGLVRDDRSVAEVAAAKRDVAAALAVRLGEKQAALDEALAEHRAATAALRDDLDAAAAVERRLEAEARAREEARRRAAAARQEATRRATTASAAAPSSGGYACPVGQPRSFTDTWGAPRSGGRTHEGTDILAPYGTPIYAVTSGVVDIRGYGSSAGNWLIFRGSDGDQYWYLHLQSFTVRDGARVSAGTQIGTNGDTGNARGTPHLHFERHPGGGGPVNPYPFLRAIC